MDKAYEKFREFKIGDLVTNIFPLELVFDNFKIDEGEIGLVVGFVIPKHNETKYDYIVLIKGREIFYFEKELSLHRSAEVKI